jgi:hypothetical protein
MGIIGIIIIIRQQAGIIFHHVWFISSSFIMFGSGFQLEQVSWSAHVRSRPPASVALRLAKLNE